MSVGRYLCIAISVASLLVTLGCSNDHSLEQFFGGRAQTDVPLQIVPLGGRLSAALPNDHSWSCAHEDNVTMHMHTNVDGVADVLVIAESNHPVLSSNRDIGVIARELDTYYMVEQQVPPNFREGVEECVAAYQALHALEGVEDVSDSKEGRNAVDGLHSGDFSPLYTDAAEGAVGGQSRVYSPENSPAQESVNARDLPPQDDLTRHCIGEVSKQKIKGIARHVRELLLALGSRTQGQGLGFTPDQNGFRGWGPIGTTKAVMNNLGVRNAAMDYRIGSRTGVWKLPKRSEAGDSRSGALHILAHLTPIFDDGRRGAVPTYVTVLCQGSEGDCAQRDTLLTLFTNIQLTGDSRVAEHACTSGSIAEFAASYGLTLLSDSQWEQTYEEF